MNKNQRLLHEANITDPQIPLEIGGQAQGPDCIF